MAATLTTARRYRRVLMLATVSPVPIAILAFWLDEGSAWPWVVALSVALAAWVARDANRRGEPNVRLWTALAALPVVFWLLALDFWLLLPDLSDHRGHPRRCPAVG